MSEVKQKKIKVLASNDDRVSLIMDDEGNVGVVSPLKDGMPLQPEQDIVKLNKTEEPNVYTLQTLYQGKGPARASNKKFREGWDSVYGKQKKKADLN